MTRKTRKTAKYKDKKQKFTFAAISVLYKFHYFCTGEKDSCFLVIAKNQFRYFKAEVNEGGLDVQAVSAILSPHTLECVSWSKTH